MWVVVTTKARFGFPNHRSSMTWGLGLGLGLPKGTMILTVAQGKRCKTVTCSLYYSVLCPDSRDAKLRPQALSHKPSTQRRYPKIPLWIPYLRPVRKKKEELFFPLSCIDSVFETGKELCNCLQSVHGSEGNPEHPIPSRSPHKEP